VEHTLLISTLLRTLSATASGCVFHGDDMACLALRSLAW